MLKKLLIKSIVVAGLVFVPLTNTAFAQECPAGQVTCKKFCELYRSAEAQQYCLYTARSSCMGRHKSLEKCVPNIPPKDASTRLSRSQCIAWCDNNKRTPDCYQSCDRRR